MSRTQLNTIQVEGNLTAKPTLRELPSGAVVCNATIGTHRSYKKNGSDEWVNETAFVPFEAWNGTAKALANYQEKGSQIRIQGRLDQDRWVDENDQPRSRLKITAFNVEFMDSPKSSPAPDVEEVVETSEPFADPTTSRRARRKAKKSS